MRIALYAGLYVVFVAFVVAGLRYLSREREAADDARDWWRDSERHR